MGLCASKPAVSGAREPTGSGSAVPRREQAVEEPGKAGKATSAELSVGSQDCCTEKEAANGCNNKDMAASPAGAECSTNPDNLVCNPDTSLILNMLDPENGPAAGLPYAVGCR